MSSITKAPIGEQDLNRWNGVDTTFTRDTSTGETLTLRMIGTEVDALISYGGGSVFTNATITNALTAIGTTNLVTLVLRPGTWTIGANVDWSAYTNVTFRIPPGALISHGAFTVNIPNPTAEAYQIFSGTGKITLSGNIREVYPEWWGTDSTAMNAAIASISSGTISLGFAYTWTSTITVNKDNIEIKGHDLFGTSITFSPAGNDILFDLTHATAATSLWRCKLSGLYLTETGGTNTAIKFVDARNCELENVWVYDWTGTGLLSQGRDNCTFTNVILDATSPIKFEANPNYAPYAADHYVFRDTYLLAGSSTTKLIEIDTGLALTNISFEGRQAWCLGKYGIYWVDNTSTMTSKHFRLQNVRWEQVEDATGYFIYIDKTGGQNLQTFSLEHCQYIADGVVDTNGMYLRNVRIVSIRDTHLYVSPAKVTLDIDSTVYPVILENVYINPTAPVINIGTLSTSEYYMGESSEIDFAKYVISTSGYPVALTPDSATPSVALGNLFTATNTVATVYSNFTGGHTGKRIVIIFYAANTTVDFTGTNLKGNAGVDWTPANGDWMEGVFDGTNWYCTVHDCTA